MRPVTDGADVTSRSPGRAPAGSFEGASDAGPVWFGRRLPLERWLTVEVGLYTLVVVLAAGLRLVSLGEPPLSPDEAARALAAYDVLRGRPADLSQGPALVYGSGALFFLLGASDILARTLPALAGIALVATPYLVRVQLGRAAALGVSLMLAVSPSLVHASRTLSGEMVALFGLALATAIWARWRPADGRAWLALSGFAVATTLGAGPAGYALLWPLLLVLGIGRLLARRAFPRWSLGRSEWRFVAILAGAGTVATATGLLTAPSGIQQGLIDAAAGWTAGGGVPEYHFLVGTPLYENASLLLALFGLFAGGRKASRIGIALLSAVAVAMLYSLAAVARPEALANVAALLALGGGQALGRLVEAMQRRMPAKRAGLFLATAWPAVGLWGTVAGYLTISSGSLNNAFLLAPLLLLGLVLSVWAMGQGVARALLGLAALGSLVLVLGAIHGSSLLAFHKATDPYEPLATGAVSGDVRNLVREVADHTAVMAVPRRRDVAMAVAESVRQPLAWYLRDYPRVTYGATAGRSTMVIAPKDADPPIGSYMYKRYVWQTKAEYLPTTAGQLWRWLVYREAPAPIERTEANLYVAVQGIN